MGLLGKLKGDKIIWIIVLILFAISFLLIFSCSLSIMGLIMHTIHLFFGFLLIKIVSKINKSLWEAPQLPQALFELLSTQTGELLLEVQLPKEEL